MPIPMLFNSNAIILNSLILQPFWNCKNNCPGCYLKVAFDNTKDQTNKPALHLDVFKSAIKFKNIQTNQLILSLNSIIDGKVECDFWNKIIRVVCNNNFETKLSLTFNSIKDYQNYFNFTASDLQNKYDCFLSKINMISFSNINLADLKNVSNLSNKINWNFISGSENNTEVIKNILKQINSCYFVYLKAPLGQEQDKNNLSNLISIYKKLKSDLPIELFNKITLDNCVQASIKYRNIDFGCSANISQIHIFPNGRCSGCPYDSFSDGNNNTLEEIMANIKNLRDSYSFSKCKIFKIL